MDIRTASCPRPGISAPGSKSNAVATQAAQRARHFCSRDFTFRISVTCLRLALGAWRLAHFNHFVRPAWVCEAESGAPRGEPHIWTQINPDSKPENRSYPLNSPNNANRRCLRTEVNHGIRIQGRRTGRKPAGERRAHYEAIAELRNLATRFLRDQSGPHLDNGEVRLERVAGMLKQLPPKSARESMAGSRCCEGGAGTAGASCPWS